ncbi:MAG: hypothetical protein BWK80_61820 [Desulfobacteraceae bacterium IS3]|nr:MAG: hypothetical protein BWK80_61820 [Desulfobacteraceae bacterium IS3]
MTNFVKLKHRRGQVTIKGKKHKAMADQLTTISKKRLVNIIGRLSKADMKKIEQAIKLQLGLS